MAITQMLPSIWSARILGKLEKALVYAQPGTVRRDFEGEICADGDRVHFHSFADLTIASYVKDSTTISYENLTDSRVTLLIDQAKYFAFRVDDINAAQMRPKIIDAAADRIGLPTSSLRSPTRTWPAFIRAPHRLTPTTSSR
jgi:hypothetical protein